MSTVRPFTPTREDPAVLDQRTVGVDAAAILERIVGRIAAASHGNLAHTLLVGPRGAGKTHLLAVARHRAELHPGPTPLRSVAVPEDGHGIVTFVELLRLVAGSFGVDLATLGHAGRDVGRLEGAILERLDGGVLILVVENLDRLFAKLGTAGQHDLRSWVETSRKVLVLASSPLLFEAVRDRNQPWFGSFTSEYLVELTADEGSQLIVNLRPGDPSLIEFLGTQAGQARVQALHTLTGGSPRLWTILADVVTVELLDDLVPAVERLLEELVTYYQQRLWDLGPNEERVVIALASGPVSRTATQLSEELGLDQRTIGTTMGRLADARIVRGRKVEGTDQRSTWYELREPLLRHYLQYRTDDGHRELTLIVEMLRHWFDPTARERHLLEAPPGSQAERYLGASLNLDRPVSYDDAYDSHDAESLLLQARRWINDPQTPRELADAGIALEAVLGRLGFGTGLRTARTELRTLADAVDVSPCDTEAATALAAIDGLAAAASGRLADVLGWLAASWRIDSDEADATRRLEALQRRLTDDDDLLAVHILHDLAYARAISDPEGGIAALQDVLSRRRRLQGDEHPDTLVARSNIAYFTEKMGDSLGALALSRELLLDRIDALGPRHRDTLVTRGQIAYYTGQMGDPAAALALYRELLPDQFDALGPGHRDTLVARAGIAFHTGQMGDPAAALALHRELLPDQFDVLGPGHRDTLVTRSQIAYYTGEAGDPAAALALYRKLLPDQLDALGPRHRETLVTRSQIAHYTGQTGDLAGALASHRALLPDRREVLGERHGDTLVTVYRIASLELAVGGQVEALTSAWHVVRQDEEAGWPRPGLHQAAMAVLGASVVEVLTRKLTRTVPEDIRRGGIGALFDAAEGSAHALAQLPAELRDLLESTADGDQAVALDPPVGGVRPSGS